MTKVVELSGGVFRFTLKTTDRAKEYAFFTEEMLSDNIAIRQLDFIAGDMEAKTVVSIRHYTDEKVTDYEIYWGYVLAPIQVYRMMKDVFELYNTLLFDDFLDAVTTHLSKGGYSNTDNHCSADARIQLTLDTRDFFQRIREAKKEWGMDV